MARATRNNINGVSEKKSDIENEVPPDASPLSAKAAKAALNKKRKRMSEVDPSDIPSSKQSKSDEGEGSPALEDKVDIQDAQDSRYSAFAGDMPLLEDDAQKILDILDVTDEQGLLDRVFPLDDVLGVELSSIPSSSKSPSDSYSLRMLLNESSQHPLRILKSAVKQLYPISSQPRSRASPPAQQQRRFCELALALIDQASKHTLDGLGLSPDLILPEQVPKVDDDEEDGDTTSRRRKYALVQRLPSGDLWSSLNSEHIGSDSKAIVDVETGYAELVAVLPSASSSKSPPTLGDIHADKVINNRFKPMTTQRISCGTFLDYGPYSSFAPSFDSDSGDIGYNAVSSVLWRRHEKGKAREKARILGERMRQKIAQKAVEAMDVDGVEEVGSADVQVEECGKRQEAQKVLVEKVFDEKEATQVLAVFDALERDENISDLVRRNGEAIYNLSLLQEERFRHAKASGAIDSDERELAERIMETLTLLASLRPRTEFETASAVVPSVSALRKLQRQLPTEASPGWHGTLSEDRTFAIRDDSTVNVPNVPVLPAQPPATPVTAPVPPATPSYSTAAYANFPQTYRTAYSGQPNTPYAQATASPAPQRTPGAYQASPGFNQAAYAHWYAQGAVASASQANAPARLNMPSMQNAASTTFYPYGAQMGMNNGTPTRAVGNTLVGKLQAAANFMPTSPGGGATGMNTGLALPAHMRPQASTGSPLAYGSFP